MQPTQLNLEGQSRQRGVERETKNIPLSSTPFSNLLPLLMAQLPVHFVSCSPSVISIGMMLGHVHKVRILKFSFKLPHQNGIFSSGRVITFLFQAQRLSERLQILTFVLFCLVLFLILTRKMRENADTDIRYVREYFRIFLTKMCSL